MTKEEAVRVHGHTPNDRITVTKHQISRAENLLQACGYEAQSLEEMIKQLKRELAELEAAATPNPQTTTNTEEKEG